MFRDCGHFLDAHFFLVNHMADYDGELGHVSRDIRASNGIFNTDDVNTRSALTLRESGDYT